MDGGELRIVFQGQGDLSPRALRISLQHANHRTADGGLGVVPGGEFPAHCHGFITPPLAQAKFTQPACADRSALSRSSRARASALRPAANQLVGSFQAGV